MSRENIDPLDNQSPQINHHFTSGSYNPSMSRISLSGFDLFVRPTYGSLIQDYRRRKRSLTAGQARSISNMLPTQRVWGILTVAIVVALGIPFLSAHKLPWFSDVPSRYLLSILFLIFIPMSPKLAIGMPGIFYRIDKEEALIPWLEIEAITLVKEMPQHALILNIDHRDFGTGEMRHHCIDLTGLNASPSDILKAAAPYLENTTVRRWC